MDKSFSNTEAAAANIDFIVSNQLTIPSEIEDRLTDASTRRLGESLSRTPSAFDAKDASNMADIKASIEIPVKHADTLKMESYDRKIRAAQMYARKTIDGVRRRQADIAKQLAHSKVFETSTATDEPQAVQTAPDKVVAKTAPVMAKVASRLAELESISRDLDHDISHIDAIVKIKETYLSQLRTAEQLLERYEQSQEGAADTAKPNEDDVFLAAYRIVMNNIPRRYNPVGTNADGIESVTKVISRLEGEVSQLESDIAEKRFEVGLEKNVLNKVNEDPGNTNQDGLLDAVNTYINAYQSSYKDQDLPFDMSKLAEIKAKVMYKLGNIILDVNTASVDAVKKVTVKRTLPRLGK